MWISRINSTKFKLMPDTDTTHTNWKQDKEMLFFICRYTLSVGTNLYPAQQPIIWRTWRRERIPRIDETWNLQYQKLRHHHHGSRIRENRLSVKSKVKKAAIEFFWVFASSNLLTGCVGKIGDVFNSLGLYLTFWILSCSVDDILKKCVKGPYRLGRWPSRIFCELFWIWRCHDLVRWAYS